MAFQGKGGSALLVLFVLIVLGATNVATATTLYKVGGSANWTTPSTTNNVDYSTWASGKTFNFGDELLFSYPNTSHNVFLVNSTAYKACDVSDTPIQEWESGEDVIELTLGYSEYYFICGVPGHCAKGQKFQIKVSALAPTPTGSTTPGSESAPSPSGSPPSLLQVGVFTWSMAMVLTALVL